MEAKDTVMSDEKTTTGQVLPGVTKEIRELVVNFIGEGREEGLNHTLSFLPALVYICCRLSSEAQAEISFKAGREAALKEVGEAARLVARQVFEELEEKGIAPQHYWLGVGTIRQDEEHYPERCSRCAFESLKEKWCGKKLEEGKS